MKTYKTILSKVLGIAEGEISDATSPATVKTWDSFNGLVIVSELETTYDVSFTIDEVVSVKCVLDIKNCLKKHGVSLDER